MTSINLRMRPDYNFHFFFFFFQAEDGIRDTSVTGVQTWCSSDLSRIRRTGPHRSRPFAPRPGGRAHRSAGPQRIAHPNRQRHGQAPAPRPRTHRQAAQCRQAKAGVGLRIPPAPVRCRNPRSPSQRRVARSHAPRARPANGPSAPHHPDSIRNRSPLRLPRFRRSRRPRGRRRISQFRRAQHPRRPSRARHAGHLLAHRWQPAAHPHFARSSARHGAPRTTPAHDRVRPRLPQRKRGRLPRAHLLSARRHDGRSRCLRGPSHLLHEDAAQRHLQARSHRAPAAGLLPVRRARLRAGYPMSDLRRPRLSGLQAEWMGRAAALWAGQSQRAAHERHRSRRVERLRLRPGSHPPGHDALRHRRHPPVARRRSPFSAAILMKFSYNWIREYVPALDTPARQLERLITMRTAECDGIEETGGLLAQARAARLASLEPIPGSHNVKASVQTGLYGDKVVVCGAPNCRPGMFSAYVPIGKKVVNGVESDGMLASGAELGLNRDAAGIVELAAELAGCAPDYIIEIDNKSITHRPDLWGHYGMAREVPAILRQPLRDPVQPSLIPTGPVRINVAIEDLDLCPRYSALVFDNVTVQPSPLWLQYRLTAIGLNPINNIVDMTNFIMSELAQPMHAFDRDLLHGDTIFIRRAHEGEYFLALNEQDCTLHPSNLVNRKSTRLNSSHRCISYA